MLGPMDGCGCPALERKGVASASEGGFRIKLRKRGPRGWKRKAPGWVVRGLRGVVMGMFGLLGNEEVRFLAVHRHAVHPCQTDAVIVVVEPDQEVIELGSVYHSVPMVLPMHSLAISHSRLDLA